jgi:hypothetical protein
VALLLPQAQEDDWICALRGVRLAFVLRTAGEGRYRLIGPYYMYGEINWDAVDVARSRQMHRMDAEALHIL